MVIQRDILLNKLFGMTVFLTRKQLKKYLDLWLYDKNVINFLYYAVLFIFLSLSSCLCISLSAQTVINTRPQDTTVTVNNTAVLQCRASYNTYTLDIVYEWEFNGRTLENIETSNHYRKVCSLWSFYIMYVFKTC